MSMSSYFCQFICPSSRLFLCPSLLILFRLTSSLCLYVYSCVHLWVCLSFLVCLFLHVCPKSKWLFPYLSFFPSVLLLLCLGIFLFLSLLNIFYSFVVEFVDSLSFLFLSWLPWVFSFILEYRDISTFSLFIVFVFRMAAPLPILLQSPSNCKLHYSFPMIRTPHLKY